MTKNKEEVKQGETFEIKPNQIEWNVPEDLVRRYATNFVVQQGANEFFISFFEVSPPILFTQKEVEEYYRSKKPQAKCVGSIVVSQKGLDSLLDLLQRHASKPSGEE